jgi:DNA-binding NarL/FixJ family response regulator
MPTPDPPTIRVLLADDHQIVRAGFRQFLEVAGDIQVIAEAGDGQEALRLIQSHRPDVAVVDIQMPHLTGIELTRQVRAQNLPVGMLVLTAYEEEPYVRAVLQAGANGYVLKTSDPQQIIDAVRSVYAGKQVIDALIARRMAERAETAVNPADNLTERELEILALVGRGLTNKAIGAQLGISDRTVQNHLAHIFAKLEAESRTEAVMRGVSLGLLPARLVGDG